MENVKFSDFFPPHRLSSSLRRRRRQHNLISESDVYWSNRYGIVFITLIRNIGEIIGVSNNTSSFFEFAKSQLVGRNINILIPPIIAVKHHMILSGFRRRGANNDIFNNFRFVFAQNKRGFIIPVQLKLKIELLGQDDFGISGIFKKLPEKNYAMMISETFNVAGISEKFFKEVFEESFTLPEVRAFNINKIIPLFLATIHM